MQGPLTEDFSRISTKSSHRELYKITKDLLERISPGSSQGLLQDLDQDLHTNKTGMLKILMQEHKSIPQEL